MTQEPVPIPPGPADVDLPRRALARLALSSAACEAAEIAASLIPTVADGYVSRDAAEEVRLAYQLVDQARDVLARAVVTARERGVSWEAIGEDHGGITRQSAQERYRDTVAAWEDALDRPWERVGRHLSSRLPSGLADAEVTLRYLDEWCAQHAPDSTRRLAEDDGIADRMVSANLPTHDTLTKTTSVLRHGRVLRRRDDVTPAEWAAHHARQQAVHDEAETR